MAEPDSDEKKELDEALNKGKEKLTTYIQKET